MSNPYCGDLVKGILREVFRLYPSQPFISDNVLDLYDLVKGQGGFRFEQAVVGGKPAGGTVSGYIANLPGPNNSTPGQKKASVTISPVPTYGRGDHTSVNDAMISYAMTAIGELTHLAGQNGWYGDRMLAQAASNVSKKAGLPDTEDVNQNSEYYHHKVLRKVCIPK